MAISARFVADFSSWKASVKDAQGELVTLTRSTQTANTQLQKMTDDQAGRFSVTAKQINEAGIATQGWTKDLGRFDSVLASFGINIGHQVKAVGELQTATQQGAGTLSTFATAGLAAGAALAGWQVGRLIADLFGLDQIVASAATKLFNFGDVAAQTAAAKQDVLNRATVNAKRPITDYTEAIRINDQAQKDWILTTGFSRDAAGDTARAIGGYQKEIQKIRERGDLPQLNEDLNEYTLSLQTLSVKYGIHVEALQNYRREQQNARDEEKQRAADWSKAVEEMQAASKAAAEAQASMWKQSLELNQKNNEELRKTSALYLEVTNAAVTAELAAQQALAARRTGAGAAPGSMEGINAQYERDLAGLRANAVPGFSTSAQEEALYLEFQDNFRKAGEAAGNLATKQNDAADKSQDAGDKQKGAGAAANQAGAAFVGASQQLAGAVQSAFGTINSMFQDRAAGQRQGYESALSNMENMFSEYARAGVPVFGGLLPGAGRRQMGGPVAAGGAYVVGEGGPELFVPHTAGTIVPRAAGAVTVNVTIQGSVLSTQDQIAGAMSEAMMRAYRQGGNRVPI